MHFILMKELITQVVLWSKYFSSVFAQLVVVKHFTSNLIQCSIQAIPMFLHFIEVIQDLQNNKINY